MTWTLRIIVPTALLAIMLNQSANAQNAPLVEQYLISGQLADGDRALAEHLKAHPNDAQARFGQGVLQFVQAVEHLGQSLHRYGLRDLSGTGLPILRMPAPPNPKPEMLSYKQSRQILKTLIGDLTKAEKTLAEVPAAEVKLPLRLAQYRLDLNADGKAAADETLLQLYAAMSGAQLAQVEAEAFVIVFDNADVAWLRGYSHLLMSVCEIVLAHDGKELFERTGQLFFTNIETPYGYLLGGRRVFGTDDVDFADVVALIHLLNLSVIEPERMRSVLSHLERMIALSRQSWKLILAETDDDREWIPSPKQTGVIPNVRVTQEMVNGWQEFLDEMEQILQGKKRIPFWRGDNAKLGVNLHRAFTEPQRFDLVLWVQGSAAKPYLEEGPLTTPDFWAQLNRLFNGQFVGFAVWFN